MDADSSGWRADPTGRHEERYFVAGAPIDLVRDGGAESMDPLDAPTAPAPASSAASAPPESPPADAPFAPPGTAEAPSADGVPPYSPSLNPPDGQTPPTSPPTVPQIGETGAPSDPPVAPTSGANPKLLIAIGAFVVLVIVVGGIAALALKPSTEDTYLENLAATGSASQFNGDASAIAAGRRVCADIESGTEKPQGSAADKAAVDAFCPTFAEEFKPLETVKITGTFSLSDFSTSAYSNSIEVTGGDTCSGDGGYGDINSSTQAVLTNQDGDEIARASLGEGKGTSMMCTFTFSFDVTEGEETYILAIGDRGESDYTWDEIRKPDAIALGLG